MVMMSAAVRIKDTGETTIIKSEYVSKEAFRKDLNANGYTVVGRVMIEGDESKKTKRYNKGSRA